MGDVVAIGGGRLDTDAVAGLRGLADRIEASGTLPLRMITIMVGSQISVEYYGRPTNAPEIIGEMQCAILDVWQFAKTAAGE